MVRGANVKKYKAELAINDLVGALALTHGVKKAIEHTGEFEFMVSEDHAREMLSMIMDIGLTLESLRGTFQKEHRDAVERRLEKEKHT
jgi:hypothetical protein